MGLPETQEIHSRKTSASYSKKELRSNLNNNISRMMSRQVTFKWYKLFIYFGANINKNVPTNN